MLANTIVDGTFFAGSYMMNPLTVIEHE